MSKSQKWASTTQYYNSDFIKILPLAPSVGGSYSNILDRIINQSING